MTRTPVLFLPGICGSFHLGILLDLRGPTLSGWSFPPFLDYGKNCVQAFSEAGYTPDQDFFVAFYDWRKSVKDSANLYLKPWIDRAKQRSGASQVTLVGHSMGGLVARSYIQSKVYADDVAALVTLGTPHRGAGEAYYPWGGGELKGDAVLQTVFTVYLWYLRHAHPFQSELNPLRAVRVLLPGFRDLLPIDDYLFEGLPAVLKPERGLSERNLVVDMLNQPGGIATLCGRVGVTTIAGTGFPTITGIRVASPPAWSDEPRLFPDGEPIGEQTDQHGDGTVLTQSAALDHPQVHNTAPLPDVSHATLPDSPIALGQLFAELGLTAPVLGALPEPTPQLVIMSASPVTLRVETPAGPPLTPVGVLGGTTEAAPAARSRVIRGKDHGHSGKHLNLAVIPNPTAGTYQVQLTGTATGNFALGALLVGPEGVTVLGGGTDETVAAPEPRATAITTRYGRTVAGAKLFYAVTVAALGEAPAVALNVARTTADAVERLRGAVGGGVLGGTAEGSDPVDAVLGGGADPTAQAATLRSMTERLVGPDDPALAEAIMTQLDAVQQG